MRESATIVSSSGLPLRSFGGEDAWKVYRSGEYMVSIETVEDEPAAVIWPAVASMFDTNVGVYAVCLSAYPYWITLTGVPTQEAYAMALRGLERMGQPLSRRRLIDLMTVVIDAYPWVARMPPKKPERKEAPIYEATALVNGKAFHERAI